MISKKMTRGAQEEQQELKALHRLDAECSHQQRAGNYLKAFDCMEKALVLRRHIFGVESDEVIQACRALAEMCNLLAMKFLQQDNYPVTFDLLKKAELLTERHHVAERATTFNNFACYYRRVGKLHPAMTSLKRALELEKRLANPRNAADTELNMCTVLSQLGKHQEALQRAQEALITLQESFIHRKQTIADMAGDTVSVKVEHLSVMCIAYHNIGVEHEFLKNFSEALASYKKGIQLAEQYLDTNHSITMTLRNSLLAAKRTVLSKTKFKPHAVKPRKTGARLLLSSQNGTFQRPHSLLKTKYGPPILSPRSIVADTLSRVSLSVLPPLEIRGAASTNEKKKTEKSTELKSTVPVLPRTNLLLSPRLTIHGNVTKVKTSGSTSPRTMTAACTEEETPYEEMKDIGETSPTIKKTPKSTDNRTDSERFVCHLIEEDGSECREALGDIITMLLSDGVVTVEEAKDHLRRNSSKLIDENPSLPGQIDNALIISTSDGDQTEAAVENDVEMSAGYSSTDDTVAELLDEEMNRLSVKEEQQLEQRFSSDRGISLELTSDHDNISDILQPVKIEDVALVDEKLGFRSDPPSNIGNESILDDLEHEVDEIYITPPSRVDSESVADETSQALNRLREVEVDSETRADGLKGDAEVAKNESIDDVVNKKELDEVLGDDDALVVDAFDVILVTIDVESLLNDILDQLLDANHDDS